MPDQPEVLDVQQEEFVSLGLQVRENRATLMGFLHGGDAMKLLPCGDGGETRHMACALEAQVPHRHLDTWTQTALEKIVCCH